MADRKVTILVVDDEPPVRNAMVRVVQGAGYAALAAGSGLAAIAILESQPVDLVVSDLQMPGMNGMQLLDVVQRRWPGVATVMVTGVTELNTAVQMLQAGALNVERALAELGANTGNQFDPDIVAAFVQAYGGSGVRLPIPTPRIAHRQLPQGIADAVAVSAAS